MMKKSFIEIAILASVVTFWGCSEKPIYQKKVYKKETTLQKAKENFKELDIESEKRPEELSLPDYSIKKITISQENKITQQKELRIKTRYPLKNSYPVWVYNPNYGGYLGAVGIAKKLQKGGYPQQKKIAIMIAKANLAKQINLIVNSEVYTEKIRISKKDYEEYKTKLYSLSKHNAKAFLKNVIVKDEWIDPKTGDLYVWVVLEK